MDDRRDSSKETYSRARDRFLQWHLISLNSGIIENDESVSPQMSRWAD